MDIALFPGQSRRQWADTMINLEARKLVKGSVWISKTIVR